MAHQIHSFVVTAVLEITLVLEKQYHTQNSSHSSRFCYTIWLKSLLPSHRGLDTSTGTVCHHQHQLSFYSFLLNCRPPVLFIDAVTFSFLILCIPGLTIISPFILLSFTFSLFISSSNYSFHLPSTLTSLVSIFPSLSFNHLELLKILSSLILIQVIVSFLSLQPHIQFTTSLFFGNLSLCCTPILPLLLSTFLIFSFPVVHIWVSVEYATLVAFRNCCSIM